MLNFNRIMVIIAIATAVSGPPAFAQTGDVTPPAEGQNTKSILADIQAKVNGIQTLHADLEMDEKEDEKKQKKRKKKLAESGDTETKPAVNPKWPEPEGRDVERGPLVIERGVGAYAKLERKGKALEYIANASRIWKYDHKDKVAQLVPSNWPVVDTYVSNALKMNVFVAMDPDTLKYRGTETLNGVPCWVIDGKSPSRLGVLGVEQVKMKLWIGQADGIPRVIKMPGKKDRIIRLNNVRLNAPVDRSVFEFSPPSGVKTKNIFGF